MPPSRAQRAKCYCMTLNNYTQVVCDKLQRLASSIFTYLIVGREVGEQGTPHLQMYGETISRTTCLALKQKLIEIDPDLFRAHIEVAKGNAQQNIVYCSKDADFFEVGPRPTAQRRGNQMKEAANLIVEGGSMKEVIQQFPHIFVQYGSGLIRLSCHVHSKRNHMTIGYWLFGKTGAGKSRWAHQNFPDAYWKPSLDKWFDGYMMEETVIIDDYRPTQELSFEYLLRLVDRYPLMVQTKGAFVPFVPKRLIITSPRDCLETFSHITHQEDLEQLTRRFPHRLNFDHGNIDHYLQYEPGGDTDSVGSRGSKRGREGDASEETYSTISSLDEHSRDSSPRSISGNLSNDAYSLPPYASEEAQAAIHSLLRLQQNLDTYRSNSPWCEDGFSYSPLDDEGN